MKRFFFLYLLPFILTLGCVDFIAQNKKISTYLFPTEHISESNTGNYISKFEGNPLLENDFLVDDHCGKTHLFILGSSELTSGSEAIPYKFIPRYYNSNVKAYGHAGNQSFSMFCQLLANEDRLRNSKIVFIVSPGWFESKSSRGTSSQVFLEFNSERFLKKIAKGNDEFRDYAWARIAELYPELNSPNLPLKLINFKYRASKSGLHSAMFFSSIKLDQFLISKEEAIYPILSSVPNDENIGPVKKEIIDWDSLLSLSKKQVLDSATNNNLGISNSYFVKNIKGKTGKMRPVSDRHNSELKDFKMLMKLIRAKNIDAYFIIQPLNALYFPTLHLIEPVIEEVREEINGGLTEKHFDRADFFETDKGKYDRAFLNDVMHFSDYGWYKVDSMIIKNYSLLEE